MKIAICGSMFFFKEMLEAEKLLKEQGFEVFRPRSFEEMGLINYNNYTQEEGKKLKIQHDLIRDYYKKILQSDAIFVVNYEKRKIPGYIGGNVLMEIGFAYVNNKTIFMINPAPDLQYKAEIEAMHPIIVGENIKKISKYFKNLDKVYLASRSKLKIEATSLGLRSAGEQCTVTGLDIKSEVSDQPIGIDEIIKGAENRLKNLRSQVKGKYKYLIAIESGLIFDTKKQNYFDIAVCICEDSESRKEVSLSAGTSIPKEIAKYVILNKLEIGPYLMNKYKIKEKDPVCIFTNKELTRAQLLENAVSNCIVKFTKRKQ